MKKIAVLQPQLNTSFKNLGSVPSKNYSRDELEPIRQHWYDFYVMNLMSCSMPFQMQFYHEPLWKFTPEFVDSLNVDLALIPHKEPHNFKTKTKALYIMQTVFPEYFTVDTNGWGSNLSYLDFIPSDHILNADTYVKYSRLENDFFSGKSKFQQPTTDMFSSKAGEYWVFLCQLPHDETIKYHSSVTVTEGIEAVARVAKQKGIKLYVKGHPINHAAMIPIIECCDRLDVTYIDNCSLKDIVMHCLKAFTINSGSGFEVLLAGKQLYYFGEAEYKKVATKLTTDFTFDDLENIPFFNKRCWMTNFLDECYHTKDMHTFYKLIGAMNVCFQ